MNQKPPTEGEMSATLLVWLVAFGLFVVLVLAPVLRSINP